jgi:putative intracellular protease/amidase
MPDTATTTPGDTPHPHLLVFDGFADWEASFAVAEVRRTGGREVVTVGFTGESVTSMGGLDVQPRRRLAELRPAEVSMLIMPGGDMWEREGAYPRDRLEPVLDDLAAAGRPIAAICAATLALGRAGLLDARRHTSNGAAYLAGAVPGYRGGDRYVDAPAVREDGIITANGLAALHFAVEIFRELQILDEADCAYWLAMHASARIPS